MARSKPAPPHQAHDRLFKLVCSTPDAALAVVRHALGPAGALVDEIDPGSFQPAPPNEVDAFLGEDWRDFVFSCRLRGREALIFFLVEHQRQVDPNMPLRAFEQVSAFWNGRRLRAPDQPLPLALAVLVHQGDRPWTGPLSIAEMLDAPPELLQRLGSLVPGLRLALLDLGARTPRAVSTLEAPPLVRVAFTLMRVVAIPGLEPQVLLGVLRVDLAVPLREIVRGPEGPGLLRRVVRYTLSKVERLDAGQLRDTISEAVGPEGGEVVMSTAQELIDQGVEKGRREGALGLLRSQLKEKFKLTSLPEEVERSLARASERQLDAWGKRVLGARKLADVFGQGTPRQKRPAAGRKKR